MVFCYGIAGKIIDNQLTLALHIENKFLNTMHATYLHQNITCCLYET